MKTITSIGLGYSGASAIYEFLQQTNFFFDPFPNAEFSITYDPGGIMDIDTCITNKFTPNRTKVVFDQFKRNIKFYTNKSNSLKPGKNLKINNYDFDKILYEYLNSIIDLNYEGESFYLRHNNPKLVNFFKKLALKFNKKIKGQMFLFCNEDKFKEKTSDLFKKLFILNNEEKKDVIIDQGGTIWNPYSSTIYFDDPRCLIIFRDPRDIFSEFKLKSSFSYPGKDVNVFCSWYKKIISQINENETKKSNILKLNFEDFILNHKDTVNLISNHISTNINPENVKFNLSKSKKNISRYIQDLSKEEILIIEKELKNFLYI